MLLFVKPSIALVSRLISFEEAAVWFLSCEVHGRTTLCSSASDSLPSSPSFLELRKYSRVTLGAQKCYKWPCLKSELALWLAISCDLRMYANARYNAKKDSFSAVQIHDFHIFICIFHLLEVYYKLTEWPAPRWLDTSVGSALHWYRRGHGFETCSDLNIFQALISQLTV